MVKDHKKVNDELKEIAAKKGATIPADLTRTENPPWKNCKKRTALSSIAITQHTW